jgi:6-pyruvoyltetrahydropterin/6-carboxytetrahydropterin synthase
MIKTTATRYHDICMGHRVVGHEGKCKNLHGHNYRFHFTIEADKLDEVGRVLDFSVIKSTLCEWLEQEWDHRMMIWAKDSNVHLIADMDETTVVVHFNPTAENIAEYFIKTVAPSLLLGTGAKLISIKIEETRKCSVEVSL